MFLNFPDLEGLAPFPDISSRGAVNIPVQFGFVDKTSLPAKPRSMECYCSFVLFEKSKEAHFC